MMFKKFFLFILLLFVFVVMYGLFFGQTENRAQETMETQSNLRLPAPGTPPPLAE